MSAAIRKLRALARLLKQRAWNLVKPCWHRGVRGELCAVIWLSLTGFLVWERNWRTKFGELDIIASLGRTLYVFEVKTRSQRSAAFLRPAAAVDDEKLERLSTLARAYLTRNPGRVRRARIKQFQIVTIEVIERRWGLPRILPLTY